MLGKVVDKHWENFIGMLWKCKRNEGKNLKIRWGKFREILRKF